MEAYILEKMDQKFRDNLPDSLYLNPYELSTNLGSTAEYWKKYLKNPDINRFIEQEIAQIIEIGTRKALEKMQSGSANSNDVAAAKALLDKSKLLQEKVNPKQTIILSYLPPRNHNQKEVTISE